MPKKIALWMAAFALLAVALWVIGIAASFVFVRLEKRDVNALQANAKTWSWKLKIAALWPYALLGPIIYEWRHFRKKKKR